MNSCILPACFLSSNYRTVTYVFAILVSCDAELHAVIGIRSCDGVNDVISVNALLCKTVLRDVSAAFVVIL